MTTMLITLGVIVAVCMILGFIGGLEDGDVEEAIGGAFVGGYFGVCVAAFVGFWWVVIHFVSRYW